MKKHKQVRFYFYKVINNSEDIDLTEVFEEIVNKYNDDNDRFTLEIDGVKYKLEKLSGPDVNGYFHLVVEELRDYNFPSKSKLKGASEDLGLTIDEYLGEKMSALYDSLNSTFMLQVNRNSISPNRFELFLSALLNTLDYEECDIRLPIIVQGDAEKRVKEFKGYKHVAIKMGENSTPSQNFDIIAVIRNQIQKKSDSELFDVEISLTAKSSNKKEEKYLPDSVVNEVLSIERENVKKLNVRGRNKEGEIETIDLISNKLIEIINFQYDEKRTLNPDSVFHEMVLSYEKIKNKVLKYK